MTKRVTSPDKNEPELVFVDPPFSPSDELNIRRYLEAKSIVRNLYLANRAIGRFVIDELSGLRRKAKISEVPYAGRLLICLFVAPDKQEDRLADFQEKLNTVWIPECGLRIGRIVCLWHAVKSVSAIVRIGVVTAIVDRIARAVGW